MNIKLGAAALLLLALTACGGGSGSGPKVPEVVSGSPSTWERVTVTAGGNSTQVRPNADNDLAPLLATRVLDARVPLSEYGLDRPQAALTYTSGSGATADVDIGQPNFDRHFIYVQRRGRPAVYLVAADTLRPVLALVGIEIKPPE